MLPSYNTYQRLLEVYASVGDSGSVARIASLMRERGFPLNDQKTKWTLMDIYVKTEDPRVCCCSLRESIHFLLITIC